MRFRYQEFGAIDPTRSQQRAQGMAPGARSKFGGGTVCTPVSLNLGTGQSDPRGGSPSREATSVSNTRGLNVYGIAKRKFRAAKGEAGRELLILKNTMRSSF